MVLQKALNVFLARNLQNALLEFRYHNDRGSFLRNQYVLSNFHQLVYLVNSCSFNTGAKCYTRFLFVTNCYETFRPNHTMAFLVLLWLFVVVTLRHWGQETLAFASNRLSFTVLPSERQVCAALTIHCNMLTNETNSSITTWAAHAIRAILVMNIARNTFTQTLNRNAVQQWQTMQFINNKL